MAKYHENYPLKIWIYEKTWTWMNHISPANFFQNCRIQLFGCQVTPKILTSMPTKSRSTCQVIEGVSQHQVLAIFVCGTTLWLTLWLLMLTYQPSTHSCSNYSKRFATNKYSSDWYGQLEMGVKVATSCFLHLNTINPIYKNNTHPHVCLKLFCYDQCRISLELPWNLILCLQTHLFWEQTHSSQATTMIFFRSHWQ